MSRRTNVELAGINTASDLRQELERELALLESFETDPKNAEYHRTKLLKSAHDLFCSSSSAGSSRHRKLLIRKEEAEYEAGKDETVNTVDGINNNNSNNNNNNNPHFRAGLCIEGAVTDTNLSSAQRAIAREEVALRRISKTEKEQQRFKDQIQLIDERVMWASELIQKQEREARETVELLAASRLVETERRERSRKQREKVDDDVEEYLAHRQLVDDLHSAAVEDRWLTRDQVLKEAAAIRDAREQVEQDWRRQREHVFLDEEDMFRT